MIQGERTAMAIDMEMRLPSGVRRTNRNPYTTEEQREQLLGYTLAEIPQHGQRASLVRRRKNDIFPTISNRNERPPRMIDEGTKIQAVPIRRASLNRPATDRTSEPLGVQSSGARRGRVARFFRKLFPAREDLGARFFRAFGYALITWFIAFWLAYGAIALVNTVEFGPTHATQKTFEINRVPYAVSAYLQSGTIVVTVLARDRAGWKTFTATTPPLNSNYWGTDLGQIVPIITSVSASGVISIQLLGNIDWRFHRQTETIRLIPQPGGTFVLSVPDSQE